MKGDGVLDVRRAAARQHDGYRNARQGRLERNRTNSTVVKVGSPLRHQVHPLSLFDVITSALRDEDCSEITEVLRGEALGLEIIPK